MCQYLKDFFENFQYLESIIFCLTYLFFFHQYLKKVAFCFYVDHIFKLERTEDLLVFLRENGVTKLEKINTNKAPTNKQEFYLSEKSKEIINRLYKTDFDLLDYKTL